MSAEWPTVQLQDIAELKGGYAFKSEDYTDSGRFVLRTVNIDASGRITRDGATFVSEEKSKEYERFALQPWDTLFVMVGATLGKTGIVKDCDLPALLNQNMWVVRAKDEKVNQRYLYYAFTYKSKDLLAWASGAAREFVRRDDFRTMELALPPREVQDQIANSIGAIDDKIELNRQINQNLEQIAQTLFKSWFVDFEPVKAKIEAKAAGRDPERAAMCVISGKLESELDQLTSEQYQQLAATASLFPDELVESELGLIPAGWEVGSFEKCCVRVESGGTPSRTQPEFWNGSVPWLTSGEVRDVIVLDTKEKISAKGLTSSSAKLWPAMSTVVAMYGATAGQICLLANEMAANQACCALIPKKEYQAFVFFSARRSIEDLAGKASGSAQQNLNKSLVANHVIIKPPNKVASIFETTIAPLIEQWIVNQRESKTLATIRDTLLPKLLSGELSPDAVEFETADAI